MKLLLLVLMFNVPVQPEVLMKAHIKHVEQLRLKPYARGKLIGYGHTMTKKEKVRFRKGITKAKAELLFENDYHKLSIVSNLNYPMLSDRRKQVVIALLYNLGYIPRRLHRRIQSNSKNLYLVRYAKSHGRVLKGLQYRRIFEEKFWKTEN